MAVGIRDVAAAAGVSIQTVSNVLNARPGAAEQTRARVLEAVQRLGYTRNSQAVALRTGRSDRVGLLIVTSAQTFPADMQQAHLLAGINAPLVAECPGATPQLVLTRHPLPEPAALAMVEQAHLGVAIVALFLPRLSCRRWVEAIEQTGWPAVIVEHVASGNHVAFVISDQQQGALDATQHLLRQGHRRIVFLTGEQSSGEFDERQLGYNRAMALWGLHAGQRRIVETDGTVAGGYEALTTLLKEDPRPTAIVGANDLLALGAIEAARTAALRLPEDLAIVGFEDMEFAAHIEPALTSVRLPDRALGEAAARLALSYLRDGVFPQHKLVLPASLHVRASSVADGTAPQSPALYRPANQHPSPATDERTRTGPFRLGVSLISVDNPWRASMYEQLQVAGEREPDVGALLVRDAHASVGQQVQDIDALIAERVDAMIVDPGSGTPLVPAVEAASAAGIPVVMLASTIPTERYATKVGPDEVVVGKLVAEDLVQRMGSGNIVILEGPQGWPVVEDRARGIAMVLRQHREVRVLATASVPQWSRRRAQALMHDWLLLFPSINGVLAHDGLMAIGALEAAQEAGRAAGLKLGLIGAYNRALKYLAETGEGKSVLIPTWIGAECVRVALRILHGEEVPKWWDMGVIELSGENISDWYDPSKPGEAFESLVHE